MAHATCPVRACCVACNGARCIYLARTGALVDVRLEPLHEPPQRVVQPAQRSQLCCIAASCVASQPAVLHRCSSVARCMMHVASMLWVACCTAGAAHSWPSSFFCKWLRQCLILRNCGHSYTAAIAAAIISPQNCIAACGEAHELAVRARLLHDGRCFVAQRES